MGADDTMMLALEVAPTESGGWRWCWYDHDSGRLFVDGAEDSEAAAWRSATACYVEHSDTLVRALVARAEAAEAALAQARGDLRTLAGLAATGDGVYGRLMSGDFGMEGLTNADIDALTRAGIDAESMSDADVAEVLRRALG